MGTNTTTTTQWAIDPTHSEIQFKVKHLMITTVTGSFQRFGGQVEAPDNDLHNARISFWAEVDSISTGNEQRDAHLRTAEFFDHEHHPRISFESNGVTNEVHGDRWDLHGNLTINGHTHPVMLQVEMGGVAKDPWGRTKAGISLSGRINRKDWPLNWNTALESGGVLVSDEVRIGCEIQLIQQI